MIVIIKLDPTDYKRIRELGGPLEDITVHLQTNLVVSQCPYRSFCSDTSQSLLYHETVTIKKFFLKLNTVCLSVIPTYWF